ncbi:hypothetical protein HK405_011435, partial [Cladochytrium tenue]
ELSSPLNVHRWRKLAGSDPPVFELVTKVQSLQRRLIARADDVVARDADVAAKERDLAALRSLLQRLPGPEIAEELAAAKTAAREKDREAKALASELNMYHAKVNELKFDLDRQARDLHDLKRRYFDQRRALAAARARRASPAAGAVAGAAAPRSPPPLPGRSRLRRVAMARAGHAREAREGGLPPLKRAVVAAA